MTISIVPEGEAPFEIDVDVVPRLGDQVYLEDCPLSLVGHWEVFLVRHNYNQHGAERAWTSRDQQIEVFARRYSKQTTPRSPENPGAPRG